MPDADERLLVEAAQRDPSRFAALYERHFDRVYAYVVHRVRDRDAAEDVTSEVFHKALAGLRRYEWRGAPFGAWLIRIAANAIIDRSKRVAREVVDSDQVPESATEPDVAPHAANANGGRRCLIRRGWTGSSAHCSTRHARRSGRG